MEKFAKSFVFIIIISCITVLSFASKNSENEIEISKYKSNRLVLTDDDFRLPTSILPINYKLELMTILDSLPGYEQFTAPGKVWITVECQTAVSIITMHSVNLTINENTIRVTDLLTGIAVQLKGVSYTEENDFLHIEFESVTMVGQQYEIYIEFISPISGDRLNGMYQDFYEDPETGETRYIATTLFAPYHARRAYPCFDEPSYRATYDITLGHHLKYHAMSNTEIIATKPIDNLTNWQWDTFQTTPSISSYITAMIVSDLEFEEAPAGVFRNVTVRVYAKPQSIRQGAGVYSAKLTGDVMTFFESLFVVPYPISKLYSVALPQFFFSAMENIGLITFKEPVLLYIPGESTEEDRFRINSVLSHENAHQYFGNIVAVKWWAYVWLKEGFASYYSYHGMNHTNPELLPWEQFIPKVLQLAMEFDTTNETHPLENYPPTSAAVADIYTTIPYTKGASILRMTSFIVTPPVFLSAIKDYVNTFQYKSVEQNDLFEKLQIAVNASSVISSIFPTSVKNILDTWTTQSGYPVLTVTTIGLDMIEISQEKFIDGDPSNPSDTWWVPIYLSPRPNVSLPQDYPDAWIPKLTKSIQMNIPTNQTIIVDPQSIGYYRVVYDSNLLDRIVEQLEKNYEIIPAAARSKLLNDYFHLALAGISDVKTVLDLTSYLHKEVELSVWQGVFPLIQKLSKTLIGTEYYEDFKIYFRNKASSALLLLEDDNTADNLERGVVAILRSNLMKLACDLQDDYCNLRSLKLLQEWMNTPRANNIPVNIQEAVFCSSVAQDSTEGSVWKFLYSQYRKVQNKGSYRPLKLKLLKGLTCSENKIQLQSLMELITSELEDVEKAVVLSYLVDRPLGNEIVLEKLEDSPEMIDIFSSNADLLEFVDMLTSYTLTDKEINTIIKLTDEVSDDRKTLLINRIHRGLYKNNQTADLARLVGQWLRAKLN